MEFRWTTFWIQIHNIPLICMTKQIGIRLGQHIGTVKEIDVGSSGDCFGKFLQVHVCIDIQKLLRRALRVKMDGVTEEKTLLLKYERLPEHCYLCGMVAAVSAQDLAPSPAPAAGAGVNLPVSGAVVGFSLVVSALALLKH
ncbi:hypothetical protein JRO89_XS11G0111800 [Xanthoceras sorbifolium]|uniref:Zinc knuckle CX2CX4HX4C domain-containing protein n=1 Tax=Xanthoceras sorbifolium TaxID=99658 RepID=A0ABQ8HF93_9ROSI|nr:hypothetical protein JRO89_XS11G0111800 [Xanthoceras sorbifolium]